MTKTMTMRERMLAIIQGRKPDRVPFVSYRNLAAPSEEIWAVVGRENLGLLQWLGICRWNAPNCPWEEETFTRNGAPWFRQTMHTPEGPLVQEGSVQPTYGIRVASSRFIREPDDYRRFMAYLRDVEVTLDFDNYNRVARELGEDGVPHATLPKTAWQQLWVQWVDIQDLSVHMMDCPGLMEEVFALMRGLELRVYELFCSELKNVDIPYIVIPDNLTAPMIGREYFKRYCVESYRALAGMMEESGDEIPIYCHMDGDLKPLWDLISESPIRGLDSMSPPPDNDTSVADGLALRDDMRIGINFPSSVHLGTAKEVYDATIEILEQGAHTGRLQIQISENVPPGVWRTSFPAIVKAIGDFGRV